jgi:ABC-2 type transport system permease protein
MKTSRTMRIFLQFLRRDFHVHSKQLKDFFINYSIIYPLSFGFSFAYLQANIYFGSNAQIGTTIFAGNMLLIVLLITYKLAIPLLFDLEHDRYVDYQIILLNPRLVILERILFISLFSFLVLAPFFPITKMLFSRYIYTAHTSWLTLGGFLYLSILCLTAYNIFLACYIKNLDHLSFVWKRINLPLLFFGGFLVPWHIMQTYSHITGILGLLNPLTYVSEGIRQALLVNPLYLSLITCTLGVITFIFLATLGAWYFFKKRVDYV